jgi:8-oxo-dGTP diphosphatase
MAQKGKYVYEWPRPMVTTDALIFNISSKQPKVLLVKRGHEPYKGRWAVPGGFIEIDEELEDSAARELEEETGLRGIALEQLHTFGTIGRDPRGRMITIVFMGFITEGQDKIKAGDDAAEAQWFDIDQLPENMAFDHSEVMKLAVRKLKERRL